jgi:CMP-N-acetylneuraminic acid synthetase
MSSIKTIAMIPARIGSTRLRMKNLALVNGKPLIYYAIKAAQDSGVFDRIIVNSDHEIFGEIAGRYDVEFYRRPAELGSSTTKSDDVVFDFIEKNPCDIVAWVNPTSPLQKGEEVRAVVRYFLKEELDSLITVKDEQVHAVYEGKPVNFEIREPFAQTQDIVPVQPFVYSVMMWRTQTFVRQFKEKGHAVFCGQTGFYSVGKLSAFIIKRKEDLMLADFILRAFAEGGSYQVKYDRLAQRTEEQNG